jgi:hypothetical protein
MTDHFKLIRQNIPEAYQLPGYDYSTVQIYNGIISELRENKKGLARDMLVNKVFETNNVNYGMDKTSRIASKYIKNLIDGGLVIKSTSLGSISIDDLTTESSLSKRDISNYVRWLEGSGIIEMARGPYKNRKVGEYSPKEIDLIQLIGKYKPQHGVLGSIRRALGEVYSEDWVEKFNDYWNQRLNQWRLEAKERRTQKFIQNLKDGKLYDRISPQNWNEALKMFNVEEYKAIEEGSDHIQKEDADLIINAYSALHYKITRKSLKEYSMRLNKSPFNLHFAAIGINKRERFTLKEKLVGIGVRQILLSSQLSYNINEVYSQVSQKMDSWLDAISDNLRKGYDAGLYEIEAETLTLGNNGSEKILALKGIAFVKAQYSNDNFPDTAAEIGRNARKVTEYYQESMREELDGIDIRIESEVTKEWARQLELPILKKLAINTDLETITESIANEELSISHV